MGRINKISNLDKFCYICKVKLSKENSYPSWIKKKKYLCKSCAAKFSKNWSRNHRDIVNKRTRDYYRRRRLGQGNGALTLDRDKRKYPDDQKCELCCKENQRLVYHHWNDEEPWKGIWICLLCHHFVEALEKGITPEDYFNLKKKIDVG
jgi:hypothetical protein